MSSESIAIRHSSAEIRDRVDAIARQLAHRLRGQELLIVGVLKGSALFLADLVRAYDGPLRFEFIDVDRHDEADGAGEPKIALRFFRHFSVEGRHVVVVKDVVGTGVVETYLLSQLRSQGPKSLALLSIIDRPGDRRSNLEVDDALFVDREQERWIGYGLESADGRFGNLPYLGVLTRESAG